MMILTRLRKGINSLFKPAGAGKFSAQRKGRVDAGRDAFVRLENSEGKKKRNLLRKLNSYRARKINSNRQSYQSPPKTGHWRRRLLLVLCLSLAIGLFIKSSSGETVKSFLADLDYFNITTIEVRGCRQTPVTKVRRDSGVTINSSLLFLDQKLTKATSLKLLKRDKNMT